MADVEVKRKGRPKKRDVDAVETPSKKVAAVSNGDDGTPPVKRGRGRPPKSGGSAAKKTPVAGRGRGRPPKNSVNKKKKKASEDEEDDEDEKKESSGDADSS